MSSSSMWPPVLSLVGAMVGVLATQGWSTYRERLQWTRQEERFKKAWEREDRHRFTDKKREIYAQFVARANAVFRNLDLAINAFSDEAGRRRSAGEDRISDVRSWLREVNGDLDLSKDIVLLGEDFAMVRLIGPHAVARHADELFEHAWRAEDALASGRSAASVRKLLSEFASLGPVVRTAMREDLGLDEDADQ